MLNVCVIKYTFEIVLIHPFGGDGQKYPISEISLICIHHANENLTEKLNFYVHWRY